MFVEFDTWIIPGWWEKIFVETIRDLRLVGKGKQYETWVGEAPPQAWHVFCQLLTSICPAKKTVFSEKSFLTNKNRLRRWQSPCQTFQFYRPSVVSRDPFPPFFIQGFSLRIRPIKSCSAPNVSKLIRNWRQPSQVHMCQACTNISYKLLIVENDKW